LCEAVLDLTDTSDGLASKETGGDLAAQRAPHRLHAAVVRQRMEQLDGLPFRPEPDSARVFAWRPEQLHVLEPVIGAACSSPDDSPELRHDLTRDDGPIIYCAEC
jgi:hypothetical protein